MAFRVYPTKIEIYDETKDLAAKVEAFDEVASTIEIKTVVSPDSWPELEAAIRRALHLIHTEESA